MYIYIYSYIYNYIYVYTIIHTVDRYTISISNGQFASVVSWYPLVETFRLALVHLLGPVAFRCLKPM